MVVWYVMLGGKMWTTTGRDKNRERERIPYSCDRTGWKEKELHTNRHYLFIINDILFEANSYSNYCNPTLLNSSMQ